MKHSFKSGLAVLLLAIACGAAQAQKTLVIEGARIVPGDGKIIEKGTVVITDDKIFSVVSDNDPISQALPTNAEHIDGKGLTVYPGLIDAYCLAGVAGPPAQVSPRPAGQAGGGQRRQGQGQGRATTQAAAPASYPIVWRKATDGFNPKSNVLSALRNNGYTTCFLGSRGVLTPGEDVAVNLLPGETKAMVLQDRAAINLNLIAPGGNAYPTTLMGAVAFLRQAFYDGIDSRNHPPAKPDARLDGLATAAEGKIPVFMTAASENDIKRALRIGSEFNLRMLLLGAAGVTKITGRVSAAKAGVVLTDDWSAAPELAKAGIPFALASGKIDMTTGDADGMRERAMDLISKGLSADVVLAAMTRTPAQLLGLTDRVGTITPGKLANLVISQGDLFSKEGKVKFVVVKGQKVEPVKIEADAGPKTTRVAFDGVPFTTTDVDDADGDGGNQ
jgi:imidazolonepropionase-like amidohydrolase